MLGGEKQNAPKRRIEQRPHFSSIETEGIRRVMLSAGSQTAPRSAAGHCPAL